MKQKHTKPIEKLVEIMSLLRDPDKGCPWDVEQTFSSILPCTIEEAYEVAEAIDQNDMSALKDELGDLLLQVVFHSRIAEESKFFKFDDVVESICNKLIRRHPHVFADKVIKNSQEQIQSWENLKTNERQERSNSVVPLSILEDIPVGLPALIRALKLQKRAANVGFDWPNIGDVLEKFKEEMNELSGEMTSDPDPERLLDEIGDLLFTCVNLSRKLSIDPENALRRGNAKFERRFRYLESLLHKKGETPNDSNLIEMQELWEIAKFET